MSRRDIALDLYNSFKGGRKSFFGANRKTVVEEVRDASEPKALGELLNSGPEFQ